MKATQLCVCAFAVCAAFVVAMPVDSDQVLLGEAHTPEEAVAEAAKAVHRVEKVKVPKVKAPAPKKDSAPHVAKATHHVWKKAKGKKEVPLPGKLPKAKSFKNYQPKSKHITALAKAAHHVWTGHELEKGHKNWHCTRCHHKCSTKHTFKGSCHQWCFKHFCHEGYKGGVKTGKNPLGQLVYEKGDHSSYVNAVKYANKYLDRSVVAKYMPVLKHTSHAIDAAKAARERDLKHWQRRVDREDMRNELVYKSDKKRRKSTKTQQKMNHYEEMSMRNQDIVATNERTAKNNAYIASIKAQRAAEEAMHAGMTSWMNSLGGVTTGDGLSKAKTKMAKTGAVSAKLAKIAVHVASIKNGATQNAKKAAAHAAGAKNHAKKAAAHAAAAKPHEMDDQLEEEE